MNLEAFADWFLAQSVLAFVPHAFPMQALDGVTLVTMYRRAPFQVQMCVMPPCYVIPEHRHPNIDSFEVFVGGDLRLTRNGEHVTTERHNRRAAKSGTSPMRGLRIRIKPEDWHGGVFGPQGGVFYSIQHWINGVEPTSVAADYEGVVMGPQHFAAVTSGAPVPRGAA